jgi:hypothetical protein
MSYAQTIFAVLDADSTFKALLTGGFYVQRNLGENGISRAGTPGAYDAVSGFLKPCAVVRGRAIVPFGGIRDVATQYQTVSQIIELWLYDSAGWDVIEQAAQRAYSLLHEQRIVEGFGIRETNRIDEARAPELGDVPMARRDYQVIGKVSNV